MDKEMEEVCEKECVFEYSLEIDLDYEFDVAKFFDFTRPETFEEIQEAELWLQIASGHPPSPLIAKLDSEKEEFEDSESSSSRDYIDDHCGESEVSSVGQGKKGQQILNSKSKCSYQPLLPTNSRLLKPTASQMAKQNQQLSVGSGRNPERLQKLGSSLKAPGEITATKRQKLEIGYLRKFGHLKHQIGFSHKLSKKIEAIDVKSSSKTKATIAKEPELATARRAQIHRSKNAARPCNNSKFNCSETTVSLQEKSDRVSGFKGHQSNKKISSNKGDIGAFRNSKQETPAPRESKLSSSKKLPQNLPIELFKKLSLNSMNQHSSLPEHKHPPPRTKGFTKNLSSVLKENKIPDVVSEKPRRCCMVQNQSVGGALSHISKTIQPVPGA